MKQHITEEQFLELVKKDKLYSWNKNKGYLLKHLSIGQMIEFLNEQLEDFDEVRKASDGWWAYGHKEEELCDALWEAVREVLNG